MGGGGFSRNRGVAGLISDATPIWVCARAPRTRCHTSLSLRAGFPRRITCISAHAGPHDARRSQTEPDGALRGRPKRAAATRAYVARRGRTPGGYGIDLTGPQLQRRPQNAAQSIYLIARTLRSQMACSCSACETQCATVLSRPIDTSPDPPSTNTPMHPDRPRAPPPPLVFPKSDG